VRALREGCEGACGTALPTAGALGASNFSPHCLTADIDLAVWVSLMPAWPPPSRWRSATCVCLCLSVSVSRQNALALYRLFRRHRVDMRGQDAQRFNQLENIAVVLSISGIIFSTKQTDVHLGKLSLDDLRTVDLEHGKLEPAYGQASTLFEQGQGRT